MKKLDLSGVRVYTKNDIIDVMSLIGEKVYVSNTKDFGSVENYGLFKLAGVKFVSNKDECFIVETLSGTQLSYSYLIPAKDVKFVEEKEKNLRPFKDIGEFSFETCCEVLGDDVITIRNKEDKKECVLLYNGYSDDSVHLGAYVFTFADLLKNYEFSYNDEWCPFGIEE